jgi:aromatic ring-opening dioxygenase catalytic subunit (LigB family)
MARPFLALDATQGHEYKQWSASLPIPKAILVFSAHWETEHLTIGEDGMHNSFIVE